MLSIEDNKALTEVAPDTAMGQLLRRYWHPVASVAEVTESRYRTREVRIMEEDLLLYRDHSGTYGLIAPNCSHRRAKLAYGVVEEDGIRCMYHGWKFDASGRCIEQPFEQVTHPEDHYEAKCSLPSYPVQELAGLIWAYLGPAPTPLLPRWAPLVWDNCVRDIGIIDLPCNWVQCQENTLDPAHTEWLHGYAGDYYRKLKNDQEPVLGHQQQHLKLGFDVFEHGIIKRRLTRGATEEDDPWKIGHPSVFPNLLFSGNPRQSQIQIRVPIDLTHTRHYTIHIWRAAEGATAPEQDVIPSRQIELFDEQGNYRDLDVFFMEDYLVWASQGPLALRNLEKLGESDRGVILFRKQMLEQLKLLTQGQGPTLNVFRDAAANQCIDLPIERFHYRGPARYVPTEPGYSRDRDKIEAVMATWTADAEAPQLATLST